MLKKILNIYRAGKPDMCSQLKETPSGLMRDSTVIAVCRKYG